MVSKHFTYGSRSGYTFAYNLTSSVFPAFIPPIYTAHFLDYTSKFFQTNFEFKYTARQNYFATGSDLLPPPKGFGIYNYSLLMPNLGKKQNIELHFKVDNILNTRYRNYLDRFRYFSDATGRNISLQIIVKFHHHEE
jgi:iron complex outermembrane receptor protein